MLTARILSSASLLFVLSNCGKKEPYPELVSVGFLPSVTIAPSSRTIYRGDTLWLEANYSDSLLDYHSGNRYRVQPQDLQFHSAVFCEELLGIGQQPAGIASTFRLIEKIGRVAVQGPSTLTLDPIYDGHYYRVKIGLIPTKKCITAISLLISPIGQVKRGDLLTFIQLPHDAQGHAQRAQLDDSFYSINGGKANNFDLFRQNTQAFSLMPNPNAGQVLYEQQSTFTVEVK